MVAIMDLFICFKMMTRIVYDYNNNIYIYIYNILFTVIINKESDDKQVICSIYIRLIIVI
jgi:hypothetical protein